MKPKFAILLIALCALGVGCSPDIGTGIPPTAPVSEFPTLTPSHSPTPTPPSLETPTPDSFPLTLQANQTQNAIYFDNMEAQETQLALTPRLTSTPDSLYGIDESVYFLNYSDSGEWIAFIHKSDYPELYVMRADGSVRWHINYDCQEDGCFTFIKILPLRWTADNKFFFFGLGSSLDGAGIRLEDGIAIRRLNLETGAVSDYLPSTPRYFAFAFSPSGRNLIYIPQIRYGLKITLQDIWTGEIFEFSLRTYPKII